MKEIGKKVGWLWRGVKRAAPSLPWLLLVAVLAGFCWLGYWSISDEGLAFWGGAQVGSPQKATPSEVVRNLGLVAVGIIGLPLAIWRSVVAASNARTAERNARLAELGHQNERYQTAAKMLGDPVLAVRLGGIYALDRLARDSPKLYHITAMELFCAFVRDPPPDDVNKNTEDGSDGESNLGDPLRQERLRRDVEEIIRRIRDRSRKGKEIEKTEVDGHRFTFSFHGAYLRRAKLKGGDFSGASFVHARLDKADLSGAVLRDTNLRHANLARADLQDADLRCAKLNHDTRLEGADLRSADFGGADLMRVILPEDITIGEDGIARKKEPIPDQNEDLPKQPQPTSS